MQICKHAHSNIIVIPKGGIKEPVLLISPGPSINDFPTLQIFSGVC